MRDYILLTDGSAHTQSKTGTGAALLIYTEELAFPLEILRTRIKVQQFVDTSSTKLELQTLLWALSELP
jgi:ribonuclease HI